MLQKLEVGVTAWMFGTGGAATGLADQAATAEDMGFHSFWLPENHFGGEASIPSPLMLLAAIASRTSRIKLGSSSYLLPIRNPIQAAEEVAVLDRLSEGRVILGVGRGFQNAMFRVFDVPTKEKRKRFAANLKTMINAWQGEPIGFEEDSSKPIYLAPLPVQKPHPSIWVAAFGPLALKQAGRLGLPYLASPMETLDTLKQNHRVYQQAALDAGHDKIETVPVMRTVFVSDKKSQVERVMAALQAQSQLPTRRQANAKLLDWVIVGDCAYVKDTLEHYREELGMTHLIARGRLPAVDNNEQLDSLSLLAKISGLS